MRSSGDDEVTGQVTSGQFCETGTNYTLYFAAQFNRPFDADGDLDRHGRHPGYHLCSGTACGAFVTFDTESDPWY